MMLNYKSQFGISHAEYQVNIVKPPIYMRRSCRQSDPLQIEQLRTSAHFSQLYQVILQSDNTSHALTVGESSGSCC